MILVGYPTLFGPGSLAAVADYLRPEDVSAMERIGQRLNHAYELAAERTGAELIKTWELSREHAIGSAEPWVNGLRGVPGDGSPLHPNAAGHRAMANAVLALLGSE